MYITTKSIKVLSDQEVFVFRIQNRSRSYVELSNYGATLISFVVEGKDGHLRNLILNYKNVEDYFIDTNYLGSSIGRFANRIAGAQFTNNGKTYYLDKNDGNNCNHGGFNGFNKRIFDYEIGNDSITFHIKSYDGDGGFPGNLDFWVSYAFSGLNELSINYMALCDSETVFNPTNHAYFNLSEGKNNILDHELKIFASEYLKMTREFIPTGEILPVKESKYDFRQYQIIRQMVNQKHDFIKGYNTYFIASNKDRLKLHASLRHPNSGYGINVYSTMPGVLLYTGDYLIGKHRPFDGLCLEAQFYPDSPNHKDFPSCIISPNTIYKQTIKYRFSHS